MSVLYSKLRLEVPSALDGEDATITSGSGTTRTVEMNSPITDIMLAGMEKYNVQAGYVNENVSFGYGQIKKLQAKALPDSLENATWQEVSDTIKAGVFNQYASVGDTKSFVMHGKTYNAEVVSINDGSGSAGSWYPNNTVDFICKELYETNYQYNSTNNNTGGFPSSSLRGILENTLYPLLPSNLKNVIIAKSHSYITSTSGTMGTDSTKLWLPTHYEIAGTIATYASGETASNNKAYTLASKLKKLNGQTYNNNWWLGSLHSGNTLGFWSVYTTGSMGLYDASTSLGVPVCFRIG